MDIRHLRVVLFSVLLVVMGVNLNAQSSSPDGTASNPYPINNLAALEALRNCMNGTGATFYYDAVNQTFTATQPQGENRSITKTSTATHYLLQSDLDLNPGKNVAACDGDGTGLAAWVPFKKFYGQLDGGHHVIAGLYINTPGVDSVGFINQIHVSGTTVNSIRNLGIVNSYISGREKVGGLVGYMDGGSVTHCFVDAVIVCAVQEAGGVIGHASNVEIRECYTTGSLTCLEQGHLGGILGQGLNVMRLQNCYSSMVMNYGANLTATVGGIAGNVSNASLWSQCYYDNQMCQSPESDTVGWGMATTAMLTESTCTSLGNAFEYKGNHYPSLTGFAWDNNPYVKLSTAPVLLNAEQTMRDLHEDFVVGGTGIVWTVTDNNYAKVLNTNAVEVYKEGWLQLVASLEGKTHTVAFYTHKAPYIGTEENPFPINNFADLSAFRDGVNLGDKFGYKHFTVPTHAAGTWFGQTADISLAEVNNWTDDKKIGKSAALAFKGGYDGGGHKVTDLKVNGNNLTNSGFFGFVEGGTVKNLNLYVTSFVPGENSGPLCGQVSKEFTIENCHTFTTAEQDMLYLKTRSGGLIGISDSARGTISNCSNHCNIVQGAYCNYIGGIIGYNQNIDSLVIRDCQNHGTIMGEFQYSAGITSSLQSPKASTKAEILRCKNFADMSSTNKWCALGGILSHVPDKKVAVTISYCENYGNLTASYRVAGISCAENVTSLHHCVNAGNLRVKDIGQSVMGGAYGIAVRVDVSSCLNAGNVTVDRGGGSAFGLTDCGAFDCMNSGELTAHSEGGRVYPFNGWNGQHANTARNINIGRGNSVVVYWGSTNSNQKTLNFCDEQMLFEAHNGQGNNTSKKTSEMLWTSLQGALGDNWVYTPGMYPRIKGLDTLPISIVTATPVIFADGDAINKVSANFTVGGGDTVAWTCKGKTVLSGNTATVSTTDFVGTDTLVATYKGVSKIVRFCRSVPVPKDTVLVTSIEDLRALRDGINSAAPFIYKGTLIPAGGRGVKFKQTADITMESPADDNWEPIGKVDAQFYGSYFGDSHKVSNLKQHNQLNGGLFGYAFGSSSYSVSIQDLHLVDVKITETRASAGAVVAVSDYMLIKNCTATGVMSGNIIEGNGVDNYVGGIVGNSYCDNVVSCVNYCDITGYSTSSVGGIMGRGYYGGSYDSVRIYLDSCANYGTIIGNFCVGGLVGQQQKILNSYNAGEVKGGVDAQYVGGLAGHTARVINSFNTGMVTAVPTDGTKDYSVGGLVG